MNLLPRIMIPAMMTIAAGSALATSPELALKRVMLSSGGVAYLEYEAEVSGDAELGLDLPLEQVDDVLKSIVVYDSKGAVGNASLPGRDPLRQSFKDLPFDASALTAPASLLNALQGALISVGSSRPIEGRVLSAVEETIDLGDHRMTTRHRVSLVTATGLQQFILEDAERVSFSDPTLQAKVNEALADIAAHRAKDQRHLTLSAHGEGQRLVRVGYVVGAPLWKASYRLTLPEAAGEAKAHLQGWAVLENMSGQSWNGVELTLLSGNPVSFRQAIYQAYYVDRPEVPVEVAGRILPRPDTGTFAAPLPDSIPGGGQADIEDRRLAAKAAFGAPLAAAPVSGPAEKPAAASPGPRIADQARAFAAAEASEGVSQVSFRLPQPITLPRGQSAIVPLLDKDIPATRLSLYQPDTNAVHPLASVRLTNDSPNGLPPGVITLYEDSSAGVAYVGDARLNALPAGEKRLLSYALDEKTKISREENSQSTLTKGTFAQGVLYLTRVVDQTTLYKIAGPAKEPRRVLLEHAKREGWQLLEPAKRDIEETATAYRAVSELKPGEVRPVKFVMETPSYESLRISDINETQIAELTSSTAIEASMKSSFAELVRLRRVAAQKAAAENVIKLQLQELTTDQARIRENVSRVGNNGDLYKRYIEKLNAQETQFETLQEASIKAAAETRDAKAAIDGFIAKLAS